MGGASQRVLWVMMLIIIILHGCWSIGGEGCLQQERSALLHLKLFFNNPHLLRDWSDDDHSDCCRWESIECSNTTGRVISLYLGFTWVGDSTKKWCLNASLFTPFQQLESLDLFDNNIAGCVENEGLERLSGLTNLTYLYLGYNYFDNSVFSSLAGLSSLRELYLYNNNLEGSIEVKGLSQLEYLDLRYNNLDGKFDIQGLSKLEYLYLRGNNVNGSFDVQELDSLINLKELDLGFNELDNLVVPEGLERLSGLTNLTYLNLAYNYFNNSVFSSLAGLSSLRELRLYGNSLKGSIDLKGLSQLEHLDLSYNYLDGKFDIQGLSKLKHLDLSHNNLNGSFDVQELDSLINLKELDLSFNEIDNLVVPKAYKGLRKLHSLDMSRVKIRDVRKLVQSLGSLPSLSTLDLGYNNFTETTALLGLCELVHLQELYLYNNDLRGNLPWCLANMTSLRVLDVSSNQLTGNISSSPLIHLTSIKDLNLLNNQFQIPTSLEPFFNFSKLKVFRCGSNELYAETQSHSLAPKFQLNTIELSGYRNGGEFPKFLFHQHELEYVYLSHVNLSGEFPNWLLENNTNLAELYLSNNSLSGPFHMPIHSHNQLTNLDISSNLFQGNILAEIGAYLPSVRKLNLSRNAFNGSIPSSFVEMKSLNSLDLSNNQLAGEIPEHLAMGCFNLEILVLSNNNLHGHIFSKKFNLTNLKRL